MIMFIRLIYDIINSVIGKITFE